MIRFRPWKTGLKLQKAALALMLVGAAMNWNGLEGGQLVLLIGSAAFLLAFVVSQSSDLQLEFVSHKPRFPTRICSKPGAIRRVLRSPNWLHLNGLEWKAV